ncbi:hypothetical protein LOD99_11707 [Oopsacas minuta]|uniref:NADPH:adrenodoxin oxidoreductase, mitochondrial n=1 Tax=Oopsacas minuta TaxID=111878 RepID=A0AAV7JKN8_9METZ|nr:hypothetical protein LOD99_11707 [Oopsacas minuta]
MFSIPIFQNVYITSSRFLVRYTRSLFSDNHYRVGIVGSGPAGFYTAQRLLKLNSNVRVDIIERLPTPFGLVRYGVAPDHPEVKNVITNFTNLLKDTRCRFYGNISVGTDISLSQLFTYYSAIVLAYGADSDRKLEIPGENAKGFLSARRFVGWYNGLPEDVSLDVDLSSQTAVIIGQGNVAIDVARILLTPTEQLEKTDICNHALLALRESKIQRVVLVGRRGPLQVAFTIKELRELLKLKQITTLLTKEDHDFLEPIISTLPRGRKRLIELLYKTSRQSLHTETSNKCLEISYLRSPTIINTNTEGKINSITFEVNKLQDHNSINTKAIGTGVYETIECGIAFRSIGYKSIPILESVPFDNIKHVIPNERGKVTHLDGTLYKGLYCSGWIKRGPVGVIASTMNDAYETAERVHEDLTADTLQSFNTDFKLSDLIPEGHRMVNYTDWSSLDTEEVSRGGESKPREKITSIQEMIRIMNNK